VIAHPLNKEDFAMEQYKINRNQPSFTRDAQLVLKTVTPPQASLSVLPALMVTKLGKYVNYWKGQLK
jgi:hypothetical protein